MLRERLSKKHPDKSFDDDEIELLKAHIIFLEKKGYEVITVSNGPDAIDQCSHQGTQQG